MSDFLYRLGIAITEAVLRAQMLIFALLPKKYVGANPEFVIFDSNKDFQKLAITLNAGHSTKVIYSEKPGTLDGSVDLHLIGTTPAEDGMPIDPVSQTDTPWIPAGPVQVVKAKEAGAIAKTNEVTLTFSMRYALTYWPGVHYRIVQLVVTCPDVQLAE